MARMIALGPERFTLPFGALGFEMAELEPGDFLERLEELANDTTVGLIVCGESLVTESAIEEFKEICLTAKAAVLVVPDGPEGKGIGHELVRSGIERAAGVDLLSSVEAEDEAVIEAAVAKASEL